MLTRSLILTIAVLALSGLASAQTWTSPDGFLSITEPDGNQFTLMASPPSPFIALWVSNDQTMKFGVLKTQIPPNVKLIQSAAEEGLAKEIGGKVTHLPTKLVSGHEVWNMTAKSPDAEITQSLIRREGDLYKLMAVTVGKSADASTVNRFIDSLAIMQPVPTDKEPPMPINRPAVQEPEGIDLHNVSKTISGAGILLGLAVFIYYVTYGKKNRQA